MSQAHIWSSQARVKAAVALLLTFVAGYVDIVGYLALYQVFNANMAGNTVHFASNIVHSKWADAILAGSMIVTFVVGSILGRAIIEAGARRGIRRIASAALLIEAILIAVAGLAPSQMHVFHVKIGCLAALAFAMGLQTAALTRIGPLTVHTTFVTGMLNKRPTRFSLSVPCLRSDARKAACNRSRKTDAPRIAFHVFHLAGIFRWSDRRNARRNHTRTSRSLHSGCSAGDSGRC